MISTAPIPTLQREFYTREDVAELLRVSLRTVDEWVSGQKITHFRKGRNVRFAREAVAAFILDGTVLARGAGQAEVIGQA
jgi:excisionase family DNA binding protein